MTIKSVLDQPALFQFDDAPGGMDMDELNNLPSREKRLLVGALNFHALMAPGRELTAQLYDGDWKTLPHTTDDSTFDGLSRSYRQRLGAIRIRSLVTTEDREPTAAEAAASELAATSLRHLYISRDEVLVADPPRFSPSDPLRKLARAVRSRWPLIYDDLRDLELLRHTKPLRSAVTRVDYPALFDQGAVHSDSQIVVAPAAPEGVPRAVIIGLHWFELGGAERWAFETVRLVREAGLLPIVLTNRESHQPWITRPELDGALLIPFSEPTVRSQTAGVEELLRALLRTFDVRGVVVHHNQWLYDRLPWIRLSRPSIPIMDSTHIVEYRGGGFPISSAVVQDALTTHHVISPSLERFMTDVQKIDPAKVVMAPLGGLTVDADGAEFRPRADGETFTVAFVGRMARQKGPEVFVETAARLRRKGHRLRYIMHGDGELASWVDDMIVSHGLINDIERRDSSVPVSRTLDEAHVLVVSSHNEGLTLTTLEAVAHGVPVVSTDVGAQGDIIPERALVNRLVHPSVYGLTDRIAWLDSDEAAREQLWRDERAAESTLLAATSASEWFAQEVRSW